MDYIGLFGNLSTNNKYSRKSPHKAILLLTVIEMYEKGLLAENVIRYDEELKKQFVSVWNKFLNNETKFQPFAYLPYWYMQSESFWHIVPIRGKEDILSLFRDNHVKPSESKLIDCVEYAELDDDLYFLMTIPSGRSSLKRVLLETYTSLSEDEINASSSSNDNNMDYFEKAQKEYRSMLLNPQTQSSVSLGSRSDVESSFSKLDEDIQILFNLEYYKFLWEHKAQRESFLEICPTIYSLYDRIVVNPIQQQDMSPSSLLIYDGFLVDLKISLMGENNTLDIIENIERALAMLRGEASDTMEYKDESAEIVNVNPCNKEMDILYSYEGDAQSEITNNKTEDDEDVLDFTVENSMVRCSLINKQGERVFSSDGKIKVFHGKPYRFNYKSVCFTVKDIVNVGGVWMKGTKQFVAYKETDAYDALDSSCYIDQIDDFVEGNRWEQNKILISGKWYNYRGTCLDGSNAEYMPKGKLKDIDEYVEMPFDYLWLSALCDFVGDRGEVKNICFDEMACMVIVHAWNVINENPELKDRESAFVDCIEYLIEESKVNMDAPLSWSSTKDTIYSAIKDYPMFGVFENLVDTIIENTPYRILKAWIKSESVRERVMFSLEFHNACLYSIHQRRIDPYIEVNPRWKGYICSEYHELMNYFIKKYINFK